MLSLTNKNQSKGDILLFQYLSTGNGVFSRLDLVHIDNGLANFAFTNVEG